MLLNRHPSLTSKRYRVCRLPGDESRGRGPASRLLRSRCRDTVGDGARRLAARRDPRRASVRAGTPRCSGPRLPPSCVRCRPCGCSSRSRPPAPRPPNSAGTCSTTQRRRDRVTILASAAPSPPPRQSRRGPARTARRTPAPQNETSDRTGHPQVRGWPSACHPSGGCD